MHVELEVMQADMFSDAALLDIQKEKLCSVKRYKMCRLIVFNHLFHLDYFVTGASQPDSDT